MNLENLYRQVILDHYKTPEQGIEGLSESEDQKSFLRRRHHRRSKVSEGLIEEINHEGSGCSICCSSASVLSETLGEDDREGGGIDSKILQHDQGRGRRGRGVGGTLVYQGVSHPRAYQMRDSALEGPGKASER